MEKIDYTDYARLLIKVGVGFQKGWNLLIRYHIGGSLLARCCAEVAYEEGAKIVELKLQDAHIDRARILAQAGDSEALGSVPFWMDAWENTILSEKWAFLALDSFDDIGVMGNLPADDVAEFEHCQLEKRQRFRNDVFSHKLHWCVGGVPSDEWAAQVLGNGSKIEDIWKVLQSILLLDTPDPIVAWIDKCNMLTQRRTYLNNLNLDSLHFEDEDTDLTIGLNPQSLWCGGGRDKPYGFHIPNIPTEEVFTTPDFRRSYGKVRITRPVEILGTLVKGAQFTFRDGIVVDFSAEEGMQKLGELLDMDEGSRRLGEVALVGEDSPIAKSALVFNSILYDENASSHIALGAGYPSCFYNAVELTDDQAKEKAGCNHSIVHTDFMMGTSQTQVRGIDSSGREILLMKDGNFLQMDR